MKIFIKIKSPSVKFQRAGYFLASPVGQVQNFLYKL
jgi:hypothetical protein